MAGMWLPRSPLDAALVCGITVDDLRRRLDQAGHVIRIDRAGREQVALADLNDLV